MHKTYFDLFGYYETLSYDYHPRYKPADDYDVFDMAVVTLNRPIKLTYKVKPICLPDLNENYFEKKVTTAGW